MQCCQPGPQGACQSWKCSVSSLLLVLPCPSCPTSFRNTPQHQGKIGLANTILHTSSPVRFQFMSCLCRPQHLAANITELLVWLFTTAGLRLYWHSAHLHRLPLGLTLLWTTKAACSVLLAVLQATLTFHGRHLHFQVGML